MSFPYFELDSHVLNCDFKRFVTPRGGACRLRLDGLVGARDEHYVSLVPSLHCVKEAYFSLVWTVGENNADSVSRPRYPVHHFVTVP